MKPYARSKNSSTSSVANNYVSQRAGLFRRLCTFVNNGEERAQVASFTKPAKNGSNV